MNRQMFTAVYRQRFSKGKGKNELHVAFSVPASSLCWGAVTHPDVVTGHESRQGHAKLGHACCCSGHIHVHTVTYTTASHFVTDYEVYVSTLQNVINKCLHRVLFSPFSSFPTICPLSIPQTHPLCISISYIFRFFFPPISFSPAPLPPSLFSMLTATWTACHKGGQSG